jgi:hypothetical protein
MRNILSWCGFKIAVLLFGVLPPVRVAAQSVAINADSSKADPSAILDLKSTSKGFLAPRMTLAQRNALAVPAVGLLIYQTDNMPGFYYYDGASWTQAKGSTGGSGGGVSDPFWASKDSNIYLANHGNVGIGTDSAPEPLTIQTADLQRGFSHRGQNGKVLTSFMGDTFVEFATLGNTDLYLGAGGFPHVILNGRTGNVGINTAHAKNVLQVQDVDTSIFYGDHIAFGDGTHSAAFDQRDQMYVYSSTDIRLWPRTGSNPGFVGIDAFEKTLSNRLQIGAASGFSGNDITFGDGGAVTGMAQTTSIMQMASTTDMSFLPQYGTSKGHLGIGVGSGAIANKLQIGEVAPTGFAGNDFAIGNGAQAAAFNQYGTVFQLASNTDIAIMPRGGVFGRVGINTSSPRAPLEVVGFLTMDPLFPFYTYFDEANGDNLQVATNSTTPIPNVSVLASGTIYAAGFYANSDLRIKDTIGRSAKDDDLQTLRSIRVTDYTMKDRATYGNKPFKKVIAQQVEQVYPQIVARHADFIPNVYQLTDQWSKMADGYRLHFESPHHLSDTAKKLEAIVSHRSGMTAYRIISIPSDNEVVIAAPGITAEKVFVYGEEVDDFRSVDYEGLTTLNVSATQELDNEVQLLKRDLVAAKADMKLIVKEINRLRNDRKKRIN